MNILLIIGTFIGGLGLFLLAVSMITDGLRLAAGDSLRNILARSTSTRLRGLFSGIAVTGVIQSSSAVTVATIGFVNAGLLTLPQSLGVIYGANVGTTITGWIVAAVGFSFKVEAFALPLIGIGMLARMLRPNSRLGAAGEALAGFGLFFIGVDVLKEAFESFSASVDVAAFAPQGGLGVLLYVGLGFFMTVVTQSSSAAIAITLTAATGGLLGLNAAAAMVVGANVGTTSTAAFAVVGATANAKRVAIAHVAFNLLTGGVALILLPIMLWIVREAGDALGLADIPAISLALFHTVFNLLGVLVMWPLTDRLAAFLAVRFTSESERLGRPEFLDHNALANPSLAIEALRLELNRLLDLARGMVAARISGEEPAGPFDSGRAAAVRTLVGQIESFVGRLELERLPEESRGNLPLVLRVTGYVEEVVGLVEGMEEHRADVDALRERGDVASLIAEFQLEVLNQVQGCEVVDGNLDTAQLDESYVELRSHWKMLKDRLVRAAASRQLPINRLNSATEGLRGQLRIAEQLTKAAARLGALTPTEKDEEEQAPELNGADASEPSA